MTEQLPIEPLTSEKRASLSDSLVAMLLARRQVVREKKVAASEYSEQLKDLDRDIYELTKILNVPPPPATGVGHDEFSDGEKLEDYATDHQSRAGIETVEITGDDLPDGDDEIDF